ncbi:anaerobic ribonucleoside-triphosphate reductase activating protein [Saccharibacillus sp. CPCC 101409]|uniref:anaerobic ribonucleoside-triphosphate reductase activating protein n=1 Tax=Saccharibacillus sp. CPCC 101409 TaxID=3058041 RepID=UPI0026734189|nr:anaerobic ribonucleoside-triphosphate reductase activating protein [Saccharibacillus sp. CPCC 101409]MDO3411407.1 anaerobic ribonucleoside-triphosphate reductase activating protein [Saccharibacillus sp. CPCC 101409]
MNICGYYPESINEGEGLRASIFLSGCRHRCPGCFSPQTWNFNYGEVFDETRQREIIREMADNPLLDGLTLAGGDPFFSADEAAAFIDLARESIPGLDVWMYTGYTYEQLTSDPDSDEYQLLRRGQVLVDGRFEQGLRDVSLLYRGSSNQRLIRIPESLASGGVVLWERQAVPV